MSLRHKITTLNVNIYLFYGVASDHLCKTKVGKFDQEWRFAIDQYILLRYLSEMYVREATGVPLA